tara:strand:- start:2162 stop:2458 length:297 start_codon:yes stop_codon:yes gene_type:complete
MSDPFKVICIDAKNRPKQIPAHLWIEKDEAYTVIDAARLPLAGNKIGLKLEELDISQCFPYEWFMSERFRLPAEDEMEAYNSVSELIEETLGEELIEI